MSVEPAAYWENRAVRYGEVDRGLAAVCSYGMPRRYNEAIHICQRRALEPLLDEWRGLDVLDAGCGVGRWSVELARRGNRVVGLDISRTMVQLARANAHAANVHGRFEVGSVATAQLGKRFDVVLAVTVLQHLVDERVLDTAIRNLVGHLKPSGMLVLLEVAPTQPVRSCDSATFRAHPLDTWRARLSAAGTEIVSISGVDSRWPRTMLLGAMRKLPAPIARSFVSLAATLALPFDLAAARMLPNSCWHKVIVAKPLR
jgi:SAM-dependent methyltransferase